MGEYSNRPINWNRVGSQYKAKNDRISCMRSMIMNGIVKNREDYSIERRSFWTKKLKNVKLGCLLADKLTDLYDERNAIEVYNFIESIFLINGFSEEEALDYICKNTSLLLLDKDRIVQILSVLKVGNLDNKVLFSMPSLFFESISLSKLYNVASKYADSDDLDMFDAELKREEEVETISSVKIGRLIVKYMSDYKNKKEVLKDNMRLERL